MCNNSNYRVFIISTRNYPTDDNTYWEKLEQTVSIQEDYLDDQIEKIEDIVREDRVAIKKQSFSPKGEEGQPYVVFVVPCLAEEAKDVVKAAYLSQIVQIVLQDTGVDVRQVFLIAHDKDFLKKGKDNVLLSVSEMPFEDESGHLKTLANFLHIYLFQHEVGVGKAFNHISTITQTDEHRFNYDSCEGVFSIVNSCQKILRDKEMIDFFNRVNSDSDSIIKP